ncbi:amidohydrolase [Mangrovimonas futianensis]|uniref:amidohydrolase n=1 Tax=Mangrovimonas futianensis TaxID=2895523 RepID=UPI001E33BDC8|nr:amidohydrolase [Mangrovimonas futianensis]MCF1421593.1 amidohydrolase [Mangrovimonas futianensis]
MRIHGLKDLIAFRKELHKHPELSGYEVKTAKKISETLKYFNPSQIITQLGRFGVAAIFEADKEGPTSLYRAELDALPIRETNTFDHASEYDNISHKCGHDGHSTILIGLAREIYNHPFSSGKVILLFQPAEEIGTGAKAILKEPLLLEKKPDFAFALHNVPGFDIGQIICRENTFTPSVISLAITLTGKTSHAAEPDKGINPDLAISELIQRIKGLSNPEETNPNFSTIATVYSRIGSKDYGISAGDGEVHFTLRCWTVTQLEYLKNDVITIVKKTCHIYKLNYTVQWFDEFLSNNNHPEAVSHIKEAANTLGFSYLNKQFPFKWGEDFGLFTQKFKGAMFGLGAGQNAPALHNPDYDFPDEIITNGINMFHQIIKQIHA